MSSRKKPYQKKTFESDCSSSDTSANIYMSMLLSPAWKDLTAQQKTLYLYCKAQLYAEKKKPDSDPRSFTMNQGKWSTLYGLYEKSNARGFYRDMTALIEHGFVACVSCGAGTMQKSVYRFSSMWLQYGKPTFEVTEAELTSAARRKRELKENAENDILY